MFEIPKTVNEQFDKMTAVELALFTIRDRANDTILAGESVARYICETYRDYKTFTEIYTLWSIYFSTHYADFLRAWDAWSAEYNPLDNYNGHEKHVTLSNNGDKTDTVTHGKKMTNEADDVINETESTSYDNTTYRPDTKTTQNGTTTNTESGTTKTETERTETTISVGTDSYTAHDVAIEEITKNGNLGVTTSQQMISSEIDMRMNPLIAFYIDNFVNDYCFYIG